MSHSIWNDAESGKQIQFRATFFTKCKFNFINIMYFYDIFYVLKGTGVWPKRD